MQVRFVFAAIALFGLSACGGGGDRDDRESRNREVGGIYEPGVGGRGLIIRPGADPNKIFTEAMDLKTKGDCTKAAVQLRRVVLMGPGYENAQTALGECLTQTNTSAESTSDYLEGIVWLRRAADAGWPEAQGRLAQVYAFGPPSVHNAPEAAYWLTLYDTNPSKSRIGFTPLDETALAAVRKSLSAVEVEDGARRAAQWQRKVWLPPAQPAMDAADSPGPHARPGRSRSGPNGNYAY